MYSSGNITPPYKPNSRIMRDSNVWCHVRERTALYRVCNSSFPSTKSYRVSVRLNSSSMYNKIFLSFFLSFIYNLAFSAGIVALIMSRMSPAASLRKNAMRSQPRCLLTMLNCTLFSLIMYAILLEKGYKSANAQIETDGRREIRNRKKTHPQPSSTT